MQLAQIKEELNNTSSNNAYPRFSCNYSFLAANSFYIIPGKPQETSPNNYDFASDPADATGDPVNSWDPSGMYTQGFCLSGSAAWGLAGAGEICIVETQSGQAGILFTRGGGGGSPSASISMNLFVSNATEISQLGGPFGYAQGAFGEGPQVDGGGAIGRDCNNQTIVTVEFGAGLTLKLPLPGSFAAGVTTTSAMTKSGALGNAIALDINMTDLTTGIVPPTAYDSSNPVSGMVNTAKSMYHEVVGVISGLF